MIIYGINRLFGRTDRIPGILFVGTAFFHLFFIPIIPMGSYIVMEKDDEWDSFRGVRIPLSLKSWLYGWGRAAVVLGIPFLLFRFYNAYSTDHSYYNATSWEMSPGWTGIVYIALAIGAWWFMRATSVASDARAAALLQMAGLQIIRAGEPAQA